MFFFPFHMVKTKQAPLSCFFLVWWEWCDNIWHSGTAPKIDIEPENDRLVQMIFLFHVFSGSSRYLKVKIDGTDTKRIQKVG